MPPADIMNQCADGHADKRSTNSGSILNRKDKLRMRKGSTRIVAVMMAATVLPSLAPGATHSQEVQLAVVDVAKVAKGFRLTELLGRSVMNDRGERIGELQDFILGEDVSDVFAVIQVGGFLDRDSNLVAVPVSSLELADAGRKIVMPGASRDALGKLPVFAFRK
jgi:sporulation protein YlmC with PRC-barrel domain